MSFWPAAEILPNLWVGSKRDSQSATFLSSNKIKLVVNCTRDLSSATAEGLGIPVVRVSVNDSPSEAPRLAALAPAACRKVHATLKAGGAVLIHCFAGVSRSASVACVYLLGAFPGMFPTARDAIAFVQTRKPETFRAADGSDMINFGKALGKFEKIIS